MTHPLENEPCVACGVRLGSDAADGMHTISDQEAEGEDVPAGEYHADCCPLAACHPSMAGEGP